VAGRIGRPHGLDGTFHVHTRDPDLLEVESFTVAGVGRAVTRRAGTSAKPLLRLEGIASKEAVLALRGEALVVPRPLLEEDEYWADDLIGCEVVGYGKVERLLDYPSCEILELDSGEMVPLVRDAIESIDLAGRKITLRPGFLA
jgi:16S rRNA processing protein RimM